MSDFVNIFVSGTDSSEKDLTVQGFFKKSLVYIDGVCYSQLETQQARLLAVARAARAMLRHENSPDWKRGLIPWREIAEGVDVDDLEALAEALAAVEDLL